MKIIVAFVSLVFWAGIASASNHFNVEATGCVPDSGSAGVFTQSVSGVSIKSGTPNGYYILYCPLNYSDSQTVTTFTENIFGASGGATIYAYFISLSYATGATTTVASITCSPTSSVHSCGTSLSFAMSPAAETYWVMINFAYNGTTSYLMNVQLN